jgi:hypothetical protein
MEARIEREQAAYERSAQSERHDDGHSVNEGNPMSDRHDLVNESRDPEPRKPRAAADRATAHRPFYLSTGTDRRSRLASRLPINPATASTARLRPAGAVPSPGRMLLTPRMIVRPSPAVQTLYRD